MSGQATEYTARYLAYCAGEDPAAVKTRDGNMVPFMLWIGRKWREWAKATGADPNGKRSPEDQDAFDAWLAAGGATRVDGRGGAA